MARGIVWGILGGLLLVSGAQAQSTVWVRAPDGAIEETRWYEVRAADRVAEHLHLLNVVPVERGPSDLDIEVAAQPRALDRARDAVTLTLRVKRGKDDHSFVVKGRAEDLDRLTGTLALQVATWAKLEVPPDVAARFPAWTYPFAVHRFLGRAAVRVRRADYRQASLMYGRAQELVGPVWVPEAFVGRHQAEDHLVAQDKQEPNLKQSLAMSAGERAAVAIKNGQTPLALSSLEASWKYNPRRALRWQRRLNLESAVVLAHKAPWLVQAQPWLRWDLDPRTGVTVFSGPGDAQVVGVAQQDLLTLKGRLLRRLQPDGEARWDLTLPFEAGPLGVISSSGLFGVMGEKGVAWADLSIGELVQVATHAVPLASGAGGVLVSLPPSTKGAEGDLALLRPGKKNPAWQMEVGPVQHARLTRDRVLLVTPKGVMLLRTHDGKPACNAVTVASGARILGAAGRYAALEESPGSVALLDILAAERTATVKGPGPAVAAVPSGQGVAVLFRSGDLIFFDRDGRMLDRAWLPGRPRALFAGSPVTPGPVVHTDLGLFAVAEVPIEAGLQRDVDAALAAAKLLIGDKNPQAALRILTAMALDSAGRVAEAEALRCRLLKAEGEEKNGLAIQRAMDRAERARDPSQSMGPMSF